jgi:hypothetical protein
MDTWHQEVRPRTVTGSIQRIPSPILRIVSRSGKLESEIATLLFSFSEAEQNGAVPWKHSLDRRQLVLTH